MTRLSLAVPVMRRSLVLLCVLATASIASARAEKQAPTADEILIGLKDFYRKTARPDGSFQTGIDPEYRGISDAAYSDLAAVTYAVTHPQNLRLEACPIEDKTAEFLLAPAESERPLLQRGRHRRPRSPRRAHLQHNAGTGCAPRPWPQADLRSAAGLRGDSQEDYKQLPAYSTSFFPLAYLCAGRPIPAKADRGIRALMVQDETGYSNDHVAATFHASHYYRLVGEETPRAKEMVARILRDQKPDGSWLLNMPARDRHATFDAVFTLVQQRRRFTPPCRAAIRRARRCGSFVPQRRTAASATSPAPLPMPTPSTSRSAPS